MYGYEIFHEDLMQKLIASVRNGTCSHAYIFEGAADLGVYAAARLFAATLTCQHKESAPCTACPSCIEAKALTNPDIVYPKPEPDRKTIGTGVMRKLEEDAAIKPFAAARKVYVFEDSSLLTEAAQNVFLKTLEEPPEYAAFIIVTDNAETLLETIRSRSVIVHFPNVSDDEVRKYIQTKYPEVEERLDFLVKYCSGMPLAADKILADENFMPLRNASLEKLAYLLSAKDIHAFDLQKFTEEYKDSFKQILDFWLSFLRDILLIQTGARDNLINVDKKETLLRAARGTDPEKVAGMLSRVTTAHKMAARYVNTKAVTYWMAL